MYYKPGKHKYIYPLDKDWYNEYMRQKPKSKAAGFHSAKGGAVPTLTHHNSVEKA